MGSRSSNGASDNDIYFILAGQLDVYVNGRYVGTREPRSYVGEMALIDPAARRSATVVSRGDAVLLRVTEPEFYRIAADFPNVWKPIARTLSERLRQRAQFHRTPNPQPILFLGCSVEGLRIASEIQAKLKHEKLATILWTDDVFAPSSVSIDALLHMVGEADFAALVFGPDDKVMSRMTEEMAPRQRRFRVGAVHGRVEAGAYIHYQRAQGGHKDSIRSAWTDADYLRSPRVGAAGFCHRAGGRGHHEAHTGSWRSMRFSDEGGMLTDGSRR